VLWWEILEAVLDRTDLVEFDTDAGNRRIRVDTAERKCNAAKTIAGHLAALPCEEQARASIRTLAEKYGVDGAALCRRAGATWDQLRKAVRDPLFHVGAHTVSHPTLSRLTSGQVRAEVLQSRDRLQSELGIHVEHFAYPYGYRSACGRREFDLVAEMGFKSAVTTRPGVLVPSHAESLTALPRVSLNGHYQTMAMVDSLVSGVPFFIGNGFRRAPALN
jgi:Polysaccharide deacetylase